MNFFVVENIRAYSFKWYNFIKNYCEQTLLKILLFRGRSMPSKFFHARSRSTIVHKENQF